MDNDYIEWYEQLINHIRNTEFGLRYYTSDTFGTSKEWRSEDIADTYEFINSLPINWSKEN